MRSGPSRRTIGSAGTLRQDIADEVDLFGREEARSPGVVGKLPRLLGDPRDHRRQHEIEAAPPLARARLVIEAPHVTLKQRLEELAAELRSSPRRSAASRCSRLV